MATHTKKTARLTPSRIRALGALAKRIDAEEQNSIKKRGRTAFKRHETARAIVEKLKDKRIEQGISLAQLADRTGIAKPNLSRLENNHRSSPTLETLERYAVALGMRVRVELN